MMRRLIPTGKRSRMVLIVLGILLVVTILLFCVIGWIAVVPGWSYRGELPALTAEQRLVAQNLRRHVEKLAGEIGPRSAAEADAYASAQDYLATSLRQVGYEPRLENGSTIGRHEVANVVAELPGTSTPGEIILIGAHYDTLPGVPGANDNGSGVAACLELARMFAKEPQARTLRFVLFYNEESVQPWGASLYARECRRRGDNIIGMFSLETVGFYTDAPKTQKYPWPLSLFYPSTGNFVAFVGSIDYRGFLHESAAAFRKGARFRSRGIAAPKFLEDATRSDHAPFWDNGYPAIMITDTANFRYPHYHLPSDTQEKVKYEHLAHVVGALRDMLRELCR